VIREGIGSVARGFCDWPPLEEPFDHEFEFAQAVWFSNENPLKFTQKPWIECSASPKLCRSYGTGCEWIDPDVRRPRRCRPRNVRSRSI